MKDIKKYSFGGGFSSFMGSSVGQNTMSGVGGLLNSLGQKKNANAMEQEQAGVRNAISDAAIKSGNPIAMAIGAGAKIIECKQKVKSKGEVLKYTFNKLKKLFQIKKENNEKQD